MAQALEANERLAALVERQREEIGRLREELAARDGELGLVNAELVVLKRMLFGRSSDGSGPRQLTAAVTAGMRFGPLAAGSGAGRALWGARTWHTLLTSGDRGRT